MFKKGVSGNPKGKPKGVLNKNRFVKVSDYFSEKEKKAFFEDLKLRAKTDTKIAIYLAEQMTGKATQPIAGDEENPIALMVSGFNYISPNDSDDSTEQ